MNPHKVCGGAAGGSLRTSEATGATSYGETHATGTGPHGEASSILNDSAFRAVFDSSDEALVLLDTEGLVKRANRRSRDLLGYKDEQIVGTNLGARLCRPSAEEFQKLCQSAFAGSDQPDIDGELFTGFPVRLNFRAKMPEARLLLLCLEEGTLVQRAEGKWRQVEAELLSVLDSVDAGVVLVNLAGRLRFSNDRFSQYFGLERSQLQTLENVQRP